jgi:hypothetical protein
MPLYKQTARKRIAHHTVARIPSGNMLKRQSEDDVTKPRKRLKSNFSRQFFPDFCESFLRMDFMDFAFTHTPDVLVTNGNVEFEAHKEVLAACSSVISDLLERDRTIEEVKLKVSDQAIEFVRDVIYSRPNSNDRDYGNAINDEEMQLESLDLITKWDFKIIKELLFENVKKCYFSSAKSFERFFEKAMKVNQKLIADVATQSFVTDALQIDLSGASEALLLKIIDHQPEEITSGVLILKLAKEVKRSGSQRVLQQLKQKTKGKDRGMMCELLFRALC